VLAGAILAISLAAAIWGFWPTAREQRIQVLPQTILGESRRIVLDSPNRIRLGDSETLRLTLELAPLTGPINAAPAAAETTLLTDEPRRVVVEARLDATGFVVQPSDLTSEPLVGGESATFYWLMRGAVPGSQRGMLWVYLRDPAAATIGSGREPISVQVIEFEVVDFFGLPGGVARSAGTLGVVATIALGIPFLSARRGPPARRGD
jgi:hypothetical protein